ncbi:MAG: AbiH family protein [Bacteroidales bacterium]
MKIVYLIGNGLDVKLNLKTRYKEFYDNAYTIQDGDSDHVKSLKEDIKENIQDWADLEKALGEYSTKVTSENTYLELFKDIRNKLVAYIAQQELNLSLTDDQRDEFINRFRTPFQYLVEGETNEFNTYINNLNRSELLIDFITFNYTKTLEVLLNFDGEQILIKKQGRMDLFISKIEHIHGFTNARFVLGVDNEAQILNDKFRSEKLLRTIVKPINNSKAKHLADKRCLAHIHDANIICLYGMSIGETDKTWWQYIGEHILNYDKRLIIFWWDNDTDISPIYSEVRLDKIDDIKDRFLSQTNLDDKQKKSIWDKIYVVYKQDEIFSVPLNDNGYDQTTKTI